MTLSLRLNRFLQLLPFIIPLLCVLVSKSSLFEHDPVALSAAITFDLLITTPVIYFLIIRKRSIPNTTVVPVFILGVIIASVIIPSEYQYHLSLVKVWILPVIEISIISYVIVKIRKVFLTFRKRQHVSLDFFTAAKEASTAILPKALATAFATELSVIYYGFVPWKKRKLKSHEYSYHKSTSTVLMLGVVVFLIIIEATAIHLLVQEWSNTIAWILTIISGYGCIQVLGILKSVTRRPIVINEKRLFLRWGIMADASICISQIGEITLFKKEVDKKDGYCFLSPFHDLEGHNVLIKLHEEVVITGFYGFRKTYDKILIHADNPELLVEEINKYR